MKRNLSLTILVCFVICFSLGLPAQEISLDDTPGAPLTGPFVAGLASAEDEFGFGLIPVGFGLIGPSPSLGLGFLDSDVLLAGLALSMPIPPYSYVDGISGNHMAMTPATNPTIGIRFSVDRATGGIAGSASGMQAGLNQQPGDIYDSVSPFLPSPFAHPGVFIPLPPPPVPPFGGPLATAGFGGTNVMFLDEGAFFGQLAGFPFPVGPAVLCPAIAIGTHDNVDAYNDFPIPLGGSGLDVYFTSHVAELVLTGTAPADVMMLPAGAPPAILYAPAAALGLTAADSVDAITVWDYGIPGVMEPGIDYALFSLAPGSASIALTGADAGAVFLTDFAGSFYLYCFSGDLGLAPAPIVAPFPVVINLDALEVF